MIANSFIALSIFCSIIGVAPLSAKFDGAIFKTLSDNRNQVKAVDIALEYPEIILPPRLKSDTESPRNINASHYLLADLESGEIFLKKDINARVPIASTTKIMTATIVLEELELNDVVTISEKSAFQPGADSYLRVGEQISIGELLHCLLIKSGNDSAYALAEYYDQLEGTGSFVREMNKKAKELDMINTKYADPAGLDTTGYSSAYDLFLLTRYAIKNKTFTSITSIDEYVAKSVDNQFYHQLENSNRLVREYQYPGAIGVKTGYMPEAGHCLVGAVKRDGHTLISIVLNTYADTVSASADESVKLMNWGFENVVW